MDYERNDTPQGEDWIDDVLGASTVQDEIGPDEHAVQSAGLIHPDDMELEMILAEHRDEEPVFSEEADYAEAESTFDVPVYDEAEDIYEESANEETQVFVPEEELQEQTYSDPEDELYTEEE